VGGGERIRLALRVLGVCNGCYSFCSLDSPSRCYSRDGWGFDLIYNALWCLKGSPILLQVDRSPLLDAFVVSRWDAS